MKSSLCGFGLSVSWVFICKIGVNVASLHGEGNGKDKCVRTAATVGPVGTLEKMRIGGALVRGAGYSVANYRMSFKRNNSVSNVNSALFSLRQLGSLPEGKKIAFIWHIFPFSIPEKFPSK